MAMKSMEEIRSTIESLPFGDDDADFDEDEIGEMLAVIRNELEALRALNADVVPEVYELDFNERPERIGDIEVEYVLTEWGSHKWESSVIVLPNPQDSYTINTVTEPNIVPQQQYKITMDYGHFTAMAYSDNGIVTFFPSGEIRINGIRKQGSLLFEAEDNNNLWFHRLSLMFIEAQKITIYIWNNHIILEAVDFGQTSIFTEHRVFNFSDSRVIERNGIKSVFIKLGADDQIKAFDINGGGENIASESIIRN
jgi:hypothetical protein